MLNKKAINLITAVMPYFAIVCLVVVWTVGSMSNSEILPSPVMVIERLAKMFTNPINDLNIFGHIWASLQRVLLALVAAMVIGIPMGVMIGWSKKFRLSVGTLFEVIRPIPPIAWMPLIVMWLGIDELPKILLVFIGMITPIVVNTYTAIKMVDNKILDMGRVFNATNKQLLLEIAVPSALPVIIAGVKNGLGIGWMVVLAAEMIGARAGVGFLITRGMEFFDVSLILAGMLTIGIVGALISVCIEYLGKVVCPWHQQLK